MTVISSIVRLLYWLLRYRWYDRILSDVDFGSFEAPFCVYILEVLRLWYFFRHVGLVLSWLTWSVRSLSLALLRWPDHTLWFWGLHWFASSFFHFCIGYTTVSTPLNGLLVSNRSRDLVVLVVFVLLWLFLRVGALWLPLFFDSLLRVSCLLDPVVTFILESRLAAPVFIFLYLLGLRALWFIVRRLFFFLCLGCSFPFHAINVNYLFSRRLLLDGLSLCLWPVGGLILNSLILNWWFSSLFRRFWLVVWLVIHLLSTRIN